MGRVTKRRTLQHSAYHGNAAREIARAFEHAEPIGRVGETQRRYARELEQRPVRRIADTLLGTAVGSTLALIALRRNAPNTSKRRRSAEIQAVALGAAVLGLAAPALVAYAAKLWPKVEPLWERMRDAARGEHIDPEGPGSEWSTFQGREETEDEVP